VGLILEKIRYKLPNMLPNKITIFYGSVENYSEYDEKLTCNCSEYIEVWNLQSRTKFGEVRCCCIRGKNMIKMISEDFGVPLSMFPINSTL